MVVMETLGDFLRSLAQFVHFWFDIFARAASSVWHIANDRKLPALLFVLVVYGLGWAVQYSVSDKKTVTEQLKFSLAPLLMVLFVVFAYEVLVAPFRTYQSQKAQIGKLGVRLDRVKAGIPIDLTSDELRKRFTEAVAPLAPKVVHIEYLDEPYSRAQGTASLLQQAFRQAGWTVTMQKRNYEELPNSGISLRYSDNNLRKEQQAVLDAFESIHVRCGRTGGSGDIEGVNVELLVGDL
jgi:hypothetical protein